MALRALLACLLVAAAVAPAAGAHITNLTADAKYRVTIGHLNEPVTTYVKTGLDLILATNDAARTPVVQNPGNLTVTLIAPDGVTTLQESLVAQFGKPGSYTFGEPYTLTKPGVYKAHVVGTVLGSAIDVVTNVGSANPVPPLGNVTFPDGNVAGNKELQDKVAALSARVAGLESQLAALSVANASSSAGAKGSPGLPLGLLALAVVAVALARRAA